MSEKWGMILALPSTRLVAHALAPLCLLASGCNLISGLANLTVGEGSTTTGTGGSGGTGATTSAGGSGAGGSTTTSTGGTASSGGGGTTGSGGTTSSDPCSDGEKNGDETAIDCGGSLCGKCDAGKDCLAGADCESGLCQSVCTKVTHIAAGSGHTCAVLTSGDVYCWGANTRGQLGTGDIATSAPPKRVNIGGVVEVSAGGRPETKDFGHTCVRLASGAIHCWGAGDRGQLGDGGTNDAMAPSMVPVLLATKAVSAGGEFTCAIDSTDTLSCWGADGFGEIGGDGGGTDAPDPTPVSYGGADLTGATLLATGARHACAVLPDGLWCWGHNERGELATTPLEIAAKVTHVDGLGTIVRAGAGQDFTCAQDATTLWCWGDNSDGQLTGGAAGDLSSAPLILGITGATGFALGSDGDAGAGDPPGGHACAITAQGHVTCWGNNLEGQLGRGNVSEKEATPAEIPGLAGVVQLAAGAEFTCALLTTGAVRCWGRNDRGQLGTAMPGAAQSTPVPVVWP